MRGGEKGVDGVASFKTNFDTSVIKWAGSTEDHLAFFENNVLSKELLAWVSYLLPKS